MAKKETPGTSGKGSGKSSGSRPRRKRRIALGATLLMLAAIIFGSYALHNASTVSLTTLEQRAAAHEVMKAEFDRNDDTIKVRFKGDRTDHYVYYKSGMEEDLRKDLAASGAVVSTEKPGWFEPAKDLFWILLGILGIVFLVVMIREQGDKRKAGRIDVGDAKRPKTKLADIQGVPEVTERIGEILDQMVRPAKFAALGAKMPGGVVLYGPPGTGKTELAKAIAGQADVPFYPRSAASLEGKFVGESAKNVAKLYEQLRADAKKHGGAVVYFEEIDAVAGARDGQDNDARRALLTQFLTELDGFDDDDGAFPVLTIVSTNRLEDLDPAFLRPGRFDVRLYMGAPDVAGREAILRLHAARKPKVADDVNYRELARKLIGAVGADLQLVVNEAALAAVRRDGESICMADFCEAIIIVQSGPERKGLKMSDDERGTTVYHEAGHTLAAMHTKGANPPHRVTIVPRGQAGGSTHFAPDEDRHYTSQDEALAQLVVFMGGVAGEKIARGAERYTNGPVGDRRGATNWARLMVCEWGMGTYNSHITSEAMQCSPELADTVTREVEALLDKAEQTAIDLLIAYKETLDELAAELLEKETLEGEALLRYKQARPSLGDELDALRQEYADVVGSVRTVPVA